MTPDQLRRIGEMLYGPRWITDLARTVGVNKRTIERAVKGAPISAGLARDIGKLAAHDEFIVGRGGSGLEYVVRTRYPRFIARLFVRDDEPDANLAGLEGRVLVVGPDETLVEFHWIDPPPTADDLARLSALAQAAIESFDVDD